MNTDGGNQDLNDCERIEETLHPIVTVHPLSACHPFNQTILRENNVVFDERATANMHMHANEESGGDRRSLDHHWCHFSHITVTWYE